MIAIRGKKLKFGVSLVALVCASAAAVSTAHAGAFALREQSAYYQGMSFAGEASGSDLSSMFWNPAAAAAAAGLNTEINVSVVDAHSKMTATGGALAPGGALDGVGVNNFNGESGDIAYPTAVPSGYGNMQLSEKLFLGIAINSQYGLVTKPEDTNWAGSPLAIKSSIHSVNVNPTLAYKLTPQLTVGAGLQVQYFHVLLYSGDVTVPTPATLPGRRLEADDVGFGGTAGLIWKPADGTQIGIGYRSAIKQKLDGTCSGASLTTAATSGVSPYCNAGGNPANGAGSVTADLNLPQMLSIGIKQRLTGRTSLYGTAEWTDWSSIDKPILITNHSGGSNDLLPITYKDGWFVSAGLEYAFTPSTTVRFGGGWEKSPTADEHRTVMLPDNDRFWLSAGASYRVSEKMSVDFAYSHLFVDDAPITTTSSLGTLLTAVGQTDIDIVSASIKYKWGGGDTSLEPMK